MKTFNSSRAANGFCKKGSVVTLGNYDGIHLGHHFILNILKKEAKERKLPSVVYTFDPHPVSVLAPQIAPPLINTKKQKIELLENYGIDGVIFEKFTRAFSHLSPENFFNKVMVNFLQPRFIIAGYDFTFGAKRQGNIETLELLCFKNQIDVKIANPYMLKDTLISSTLIRKHVQEGNVREAGALLKRPFFIDGKIVRGKKRGEMLGIHTSNLKTENELIPREGVYVTKTIYKNKTYGSVTNIGYNPTFGNTKLSIETHIFNFNKKTYGDKMRLLFLERIRDEIKFRDPKQLVQQIKKDMGTAKRILGKKG